MSAWWMRLVVSGLTATAEALYPANDLGAPDWKDVALVPRCLRWMEELPPRQRDQLYLLFAATELLAPVMAPGLRRFSKIPVEKRERLVRRWRVSKFLPLKLIADSLKATTSMMYLSHPAALDYIGMHKDSACGRVSDIRVRLKKNALAVKP